jgi:hypothetical protein
MQMITANHAGALLAFSIMGLAAAHGAKAPAELPDVPFVCENANCSAEGVWNKCVLPSDKGFDFDLACALLVYKQYFLPKKGSGNDQRRH